MPQKTIRYAIFWARTLAILCLFAPAVIQADVFYGKNQAIEMAFPDADRIERRTLVISREEAKELERLSKSRLPSRLITIYEGWKGTDLLGYMHIDVHPVWAKSQALMIVMNPAGKFTQIEVLAFHESTDYMLPTQILKNLMNKFDSETITVGKDVDAVTGASITHRSSTEALRRARVYYELLLVKRDTSPSP
jgi:hypothetical protein